MTNVTRTKEYNCVSSYYSYARDNLREKECFLY